MPTIRDICALIEEVAPLSLQESYDNAGLQIGNLDAEATSALLCIDVTENIIEEATELGCNLIISHHPLIFSGLKRLTGQNEVQRCVVKAIQNDIALYAAHTNLDNVIPGVNGMIARKLGLKNVRILQPKLNGLLKLITFVPHQQAEALRESLFKAGAGHIGNYDACSFNSEGYGTFRANRNANPYVGELNQLHVEPETRIEVILPEHSKNQVIKALFESHPYEEPAFDLISLANQNQQIGSGLVGELEIAVDELTFLHQIKQIFDLEMIKYTSLRNKPIKKVAVCGGSGSFLINDAIKSQADLFISGDFKYHEFFTAEKKIILADIGHFESEQFTKDIFFEIITKKMPTFAVRIAKTKTNPINYL